MYVSELFVDGKCIIDSLAGPWEKIGVWGDVTITGYMTSACCHLLSLFLCCE